VIDAGFDGPPYVALEPVKVIDGNVRPKPLFVYEIANPVVAPEPTRPKLPGAITFFRRLVVVVKLSVLDPVFEILSVPLVGAVPSKMFPLGTPAKAAASVAVPPVGLPPPAGTKLTAWYIHPLSAPPPLTVAVVLVPLVVDAAADAEILVGRVVVFSPQEYFVGAVPPLRSITEIPVPAGAAVNETSKVAIRNSEK
jgi:hypothetical protein